MRALFLLWILSWSYLAAQEDDVPNVSAFNICAYNVKNWLLMDRTPGQEGAPMKGKQEKEKRYVINNILATEPDMVGLCEVGSDKDVAEIQERLSKKGLDLPHVERCQGRDATRTLVLLSRFPFVKKLSHTELPYRIGEMELGVQRGILHAVVEPRPGFQLHVMGVHLKSKRTVPEADESLMRRNEFVHLRRIIDGVLQAEPGAKIVAYGDFNEHRGEHAFKDFLGARDQADKQLMDIPIKDSNGEVWTHFWDSMDTYSRLDYFVVSPALRTHIDNKRSYIYTSPEVLEGSDHRPLVLRITAATAKQRRRR
jgi:endonuclease/exonuclease/phosphatase family metal-dependent hydrolase